MRHAFLGVCLATISISAFADGCTDAFQAAQRAADVRDAGVQKRMFLEMPETIGSSPQAVLLRDLADFAYRFPVSDSRKLVALYRPQCVRPDHVEWEAH